MVVAVCLVSTVGVFAVNKKTQLLVTQNLSEKLRSDLGNDGLQVKLNNVSQSKISADEIEGDATCILADEGISLPLRFRAKIDPVDQNVLSVGYDFVDSTVSYAPTSTEEVLMRELMTKIKGDYKTENIVIAIDAVENVEGVKDEKKFLGSGEVRIGGFVWNKIKFDVALDAQTQKANNIIYQIEK